ncbi:LANO_0H18470g1_1 [Lachancea nothofagi CBS 11611]|uniref:LANO_0H18470g1_1 n=1 Tax=Lachancea nothofagi CBS 11611 TaxID=1266666 RepID=A0A1G4KNE7_9SACH|nr:LANO_0H18470g1_1 [Lachancea nothofagi CBS 11611]
MDPPAHDATQSGTKRTVATMDSEIESLAASMAGPVLTERQNKRVKRYAPMTQVASQIESTEDEASSNWHPPGYIKHLKLRNFMCHEHFQLDLGPKLNFIVGNNGSGKSAILTAITVGLGAKATDTNRGTSLKDLIRDGCSSAKIEIVLNNEGFGGYEQGTYGNEIVIERTIKRDGPAKFSIKGENREEVSHTKRDLQAIVEYFAVPVMNPMCFLSQDAARSFLTASTPADKYKHFMRGTLLEDTEINLNRALEIAISAQNNLDFHAKNVKELRQEFEGSKGLLKQLTANQDLNRRKKALQGKLLWLSVVENENSLLKLQEGNNSVQDKIIEVEKKISGRNTTIERLDSDQTAMEQKTEDALNNWQDKKRAFEDTRLAMNRVKVEFDTQKQNRAETAELIKGAESKILSFNKIIANFEDQLRKQMGGDKKQMQDEAEGLKLKVEASNKRLSTSNVRLGELRERITALSAQNEELITAKKDSIVRKQEYLNRALQGNNSFLANFDLNMEKVIRTIEQRQNEFATKPLGPLGAHVKVKNEFKEWTRSIQRYLRGTVGAFVVSTVEDNALLKQIFRSCNLRVNPNVMTYKFDEFDFNAGSAKVSYPTIVDALEFDSRALRCLFVDQNRIEKVLLIKNKDEAREVLMGKPRNVILTLSILDAYNGFQCSMTPAKPFAIDSVAFDEKLKLVTETSSEDDIAYLKSLIIGEKADLEELIENHKQSLAKLKAHRNDIELEMKSLKQEITASGKREVSIRMELEREIDTGVREQAEADKDTYEEAISSYSLALEEIDKKLDEISQKAQPLKQTLSDSKHDVQEAEDAMTEIKQSSSSRSAKLEKLHEDVKYYNEKLVGYQRKLEETSRKIQEFQIGIEGQISNAEVYCSRDVAYAQDMPGTKEDVKAEIERVTIQIQRAESRVGLSQDQVVELFEKAKLKYKSAEKRYAEMDNVIIQLNNSINRRLQSLNYGKTDTCGTADTDFKQSLRFRNYSGGLNFDFNKRTLNMFVKTPNDDQPRNVDTFSGGEKSFSQIALLLATWRPMRSRILALDEFDVFMDQVNREIGTRLIMRKLFDDNRTQTVIITPQDIGKIASLDFPGICIHRMNDPERQNNSDFYS